MKQLNVTFEDGEFEAIEQLKKESGLGWREFIMLVITHCREAVIRGDLEFLK